MVPTVRWLLLSALVMLAGCQSAPREVPRVVSPEAARRVFVPEPECEPALTPEAGRRLASRLAERVREGVSAAGHVLVETQAEAEAVLATGLGFAFHPGGDVKELRLFVRIAEGGVWLDDWAREPETFYLMPPSPRDVEALADEIVSRLTSALESAPGVAPRAGH